MSYLDLARFATNGALTVEMQSAEAIVAMCLWGEARGTDVRGKIAVASVLRTRAETRPGRFYPAALASLPLVTRMAASALKPKAFSCFNAGDPNRSKLLHAPTLEAKAWTECVAVAAAVIDGLFADPTAGGNHYISYSLMDYAKGKWPDWARPGHETAVIGPFRFYRLT